MSTFLYLFYFALFLFMRTVTLLRTVYIGLFIYANLYFFYVPFFSLGCTGADLCYYAIDYVAGGFITGCTVCFVLFPFIWIGFLLQLFLLGSNNANRATRVRLSAVSSLFSLGAFPFFPGMCNYRYCYMSDGTYIVITLFAFVTLLAVAITILEYTSKTKRA